MSEFCPLTPERAPAPSREQTISPTKHVASLLVGKYECEDLAAERLVFDPQDEEENKVQRFSRAYLTTKFGSSFVNQGKTKSGVVSKEVDTSRSLAVEDGRVLLRNDGKVDKMGNVVLNEEGDIVVGESKLCTSKELVMKTTNASHILSFEVMDAVFAKTGHSVNMEKAAQIVQSMNRHDNLLLKSGRGNMDGTRTMPGLGDRDLDGEIISYIEKGEGKLSKEAAQRAKRIVEIVAASKDLMPTETIHAVLNCFKPLTDNEGKKICRKNKAITAVKENESRRSYYVDKDLGGLKNDGTPDLRTKKGEELQSRRESGLKSDGTPDLRTKKGKELQRQQELATAQQWGAEMC